MVKLRPLSKSRFKLGHECPTKLFYTGKKEYKNANDDNAFLLALAEGGYQVGELAKLYYPGGVELHETDYVKAHEGTAALLREGKKIIYEASVLYQDYFIRIDILNKTSEHTFELIEVKAKSFDTHEEDPFWNQVAKKKKIKALKSVWEDYLYDVAFQTWVMRQAFPEYKIKPYLLLADKNTKATVDGLNQLFPISKNAQGRIHVDVDQNITQETLGEKLLTKVDVSSVVEFILNESKNGEGKLPFDEYVKGLAGFYREDLKALPIPGSKCKSCEFYAETQAPESLAPGSPALGVLKSGFHECWKEAFRTDDATLNEALITELWNFKKSDEYLDLNVFLLKDLPESAINVKTAEHPGLSYSERQLLQLQKVKDEDHEVYFDRTSMRAEIEKWIYPLHFIDFETMTTAIPFHAGQKPYEAIAFQFSHHQMEEDGTYHHVDEFIFAEKGIFPNFEFVRALKKTLERDQGTILRYAPHENTILNHIHLQLLDSQEKDRDELIDFIESITHQKENKEKKQAPRKGKRDMVDLFELLKRYYFDPETHGSNSLKDVFPAVLNRSTFLQKKYSKPIYGVAGATTLGGSASSSQEGIRSKNYKNKIWIERDAAGKIINPYETLPPIFEGLTFEEAERVFSGDELKEGGSASIAYARMQFEKMHDKERHALQAALLRYCELDTLAMIMLFEAWKAEL